jgi:hypothetical protein
MKRNYHQLNSKPYEDLYLQNNLIGNSEMMGQVFRIYPKSFKYLYLII